ncbi:flavin-containing monooxygenase [Bradyrhizobium sp.]
MSAKICRLTSDPRFNVEVLSFDIQDRPARLTTTVRVAGMSFRSSITYHSIDEWRQVWAALGDPDAKSLVLGALVAWDCMRFLGLGGAALVLCEGLTLDTETAALWRHAFLNQYGEWRYRNCMVYHAGGWPKVISARPGAGLGTRRRSEGSRTLVTNGGGKDTLTGMLLLQDAGVAFDVYEATLPMGGHSAIQDALLRDLRLAVAPGSVTPVRVTVTDDFYSADDAMIEALGVVARHYKSDFAVGHTANYVGFFPLILAHGYSAVWFNIERSADRTMARWGTESINHQWCKSSGYRRLVGELFRRIAGVDGFEGFRSTLGGLQDSLIYRIAATAPEALRKSHSCNLDKPWCLRCPKCCFSYLMLTSVMGEPFAREMMGTKESLFDAPAVQAHWRDLLDPSRVAWECVGSHDECLLALGDCSEPLRSAAIQAVAPRVNARQRAEMHERYHAVDWRATPRRLRRATLQRLGAADATVTTDVVVIGAGQSGLSCSQVLAAKNVNHVVLERACEGASWKDRWDSFRLNTPNRTLSLPGLAYSGDDPDGFSTAAEVQAFLSSYSEQYDLPVVGGCEVLEVERLGGAFLITTNFGRLRARAVVVATGEYCKARFPLTTVEDLRQQVQVLHSSVYRNPDALADGAVLVVGGGQSGAQIVEDLLAGGRQVYWSLSNRPSNVRRLRGRDFMEWWDVGGILHRHVRDIPEVRRGGPAELRRARSMEFPLVSGISDDGRGHSISLARLERSGVTLLGKLAAHKGRELVFSDRLPEQMAEAVTGSRKERAFLNEVADAAGAPPEGEGDAVYIPEELQVAWRPQATPTRLDLAQARIGAVVFATGFSSAWPWLSLEGVLDEHGYPLGEDGVTPVPGVFFLGLFNLQRLSSTCLCNGGRDSEVLVPHILKHLARRSSQPVAAKALASEEV